MIFVNRKFINCVVTAGEKVRKFLIFRDHACLFEFHAFESRSLSRILFSLISLLFVFISIKTHIFSYIFFLFGIFTPSYCFCICFVELIQHRGYLLAIYGL